MNTKMKRSTATWIWDFAGEYRSRYVLSVLSAVCGVICGILPYFVMANMIGDLLGGKYRILSVVGRGVVVGGCILTLSCAFPEGADPVSCGEWQSEHHDGQQHPQPG